MSSSLRDSLTQAGVPEPAVTPLLRYYFVQHQLLKKKGKPSSIGLFVERVKHCLKHKPKAA